MIGTGTAHLIFLDVKDQRQYWFWHYLESGQIYSEIKMSKIELVIEAKIT